MDRYSILKDVIVPVLSPLVAAAALLVGFFRNARRLQRDAVMALYRDLDWTWQQYHLYGGAMKGGQGVEPERVAELHKAWRRVFHRILSDSDAMNAFYQRHLRNARGNPMLLISNAKVISEKARKDPSKLPDLELQFTLHNLLYLCEPDRAKIIQHRDALRACIEKREDFRNLVMERPGWRWRGKWGPTPHNQPL